MGVVALVLVVAGLVVVVVGVVGIVRNHWRTAAPTGRVCTPRAQFGLDQQRRAEVRRSVHRGTPAPGPLRALVSLLVLWWRRPLAAAAASRADG